MRRTASRDAGGADDVGLVGADGVFVGAADEGLVGEVEDDFGAEVADGGVETGCVADVAADVVEDVADAGGGEEVGVGPGVEGVAADLCSEMREPGGLASRL